MPLRSDIAERLGIGNSTGLGMAPFIINHPVLFNNWIMVREEAIARVRAVVSASETEIELFLNVFEGAKILVDRWQSQHPTQCQKLDALRADSAAVTNYLADHGLHRDHPWDELLRWADDELSEEGQEWIASLILEPYGHLVDDLACCMADSYTDDFRIDGAMPIGEARTLIEKSFAWALDLDWSDPAQCARAWYVSEEKLEPRLGERFDEPIADYEQPLAPARDAVAAHIAMYRWADETKLAEFLLAHPEHRHTLRRAQMSVAAPYGEIHDNTISANVMPIDMLRAKLSFFGATQFDPRSDRWVRICMYANAPYPEDLNASNADRWVYPEPAP